MKYFLFSFFLMFLSLVQAQQITSDVQFEDRTYLPNIRTVEFFTMGNEFGLPIVDLQSSGALVLTFDDRSEDARDYSYTIVHCNHNWELSDEVTDMDYLDGFNEEVLDEYDFSFKTISSYTHYTLFLPNDDMGWLLSGNYLLIVYDDEDDRRVAITRRFMVVDNRVDIRARIVNAARVEKMRTHHEIDFIVDHEKYPIRNPEMEVRAVIVQNGRWDNAVMDLPPKYSRLDEMVFDYQDKVIFPGGKEFRTLDFRSLEYRSTNLEAIERYDYDYDVTLYKDEKRYNRSHLSREDLDGNFVIETRDERNNELSSEYANVLFRLYSPEPYEDKEVYVFGALSEWQINPLFKMKHNPLINCYVAKVPLKQGFYGYCYAVADEVDEKVVGNLSEIEGDSDQTENRYTILIYYRAFGVRYDQLIGVQTLFSKI